MNINDLKLGDLFRFISMLGSSAEPKAQRSISQDYIGKYVLVRSRNEGINAGYLKDADETGCVLTDARRLWYHEPAVFKECWYEGVANHGLSDDSKISASVLVKVIVEDYSLTVCTDKAIESIREAQSHAQN